MLMRTKCKGTNQNGAPRTKGHPPDLLFAKASGAESSQPSRTLADTFAHTNRRFRIPGHFITPAKPPWIDGLDPPGDTRLHVRLHHSGRLCWVIARCGGNMNRIKRFHTRPMGLDIRKQFPPFVRRHPTWMMFPLPIT